MQSVIGRLDDSVMRMIEDSVEESSKSSNNESSKSRLPGEGRVNKMSIDRVKDYFRQFGMENRIKEFNVSSATVELAAEAVGCEPARIVKTLSFKVGDKPILIACAGDAKIANPRYKAEFGEKAKMLTPEEAVSLIGHAVGGLCPFALNDGVEVYLDESIRRFDVVYPAAGSDNSAIGLTPEELEKYAQGFVRWVDVCKGWNE